MSNVRHLRPASALFQRGDLVALHDMPYVVVHVSGAVADLFPGDDLAAVSAMGRVLVAVGLLGPRPERHTVTIEPVAPDNPAHYVAEWDVPPRLAITEHRTGHPVTYHGTEGWVALTDMRARALAVAARVGAEYVEPSDELAVELLGLAVAS